jgi:endoglucanase
VSTVVPSSSPPSRRLRRSGLAAAVTAAALVATGLVAAPAAQAKHDRPASGFYVPPPDPDAPRQVRALRKAGQKVDAARIEAMIETPQAVWINGGTTDARSRAQVRQVVKRAAAQRKVPVLVLYNVPYRDCAQYSSGGASTIAEYASWIRAVAKGIGRERAVVLLEPDGLGIIPNYTPVGQTEPEWCRPTVDGAPAPEADAQSRFTALNDAVDVLTALPKVDLYLDGTHTGWLNVGDISDRLLKAGVLRADGFFLNVSNYQFTTNQLFYGTWISSCLAWVTQVTTPASVADCPNQYWNGGPTNNWTGVALTKFATWSDTATQADRDTSSITARYAGLLGDVEPTARFVVDTSRNGVGPWEPPAGVYPDPQDWCNPPDRALGDRPTTRTGNPLAAALLWAKIPGESDGQCNRGVAGSTTDPEWGGIVDPAAGDWFPEMALELARNAVPPLR